MIKAIENYTQRLLARSNFATRLAVKIRNQSNCIIAYHLGESSHADKNGELKLLKITAPHVKTFIDVPPRPETFVLHLGGMPTIADNPILSPRHRQDTPQLGSGISLSPRDTNPNIR